MYCKDNHVILDADGTAVDAFSQSSWHLPVTTWISATRTLPETPATLQVSGLTQGIPEEPQAAGQAKARKLISTLIEL